MKRPTLKAEKREVLGKKVKQLRREGFLPANIYGKDMASLAIQVKTADFISTYKEVGATGVVNIEVDDKKYPSMMKGLQMNHQLHQPLHVDFHKVNLKEKTKANIPVILTGEAPAVNEKLGTLLQSLAEVEVEALPDNLPDTLEISAESLTELGSTITVANLKAPEDVTILTEGAQLIAKIEEIAEEPEPEPEETEEGAEGEAGEEGESTEGEGEKKSEGEGKEEKADDNAEKKERRKIS